MKDGMTNMENHIFRLKIEVETNKIDKSMLEEMNKKQRQQLDEIKDEKDKIFKQFKDSLNEIEKIKMEIINARPSNE